MSSAFPVSKSFGEEMSLFIKLQKVLGWFTVLFLSFWSSIKHVCLYGKILLTKVYSKTNFKGLPVLLNNS